MLKTGSIILIATLVFSLISNNFSFAEDNFSGQIIVRTSKTSYQSGEQIKIFGKVQSVQNTPVAIMISNNGNIVDIGQVDVSSDGTFTYYPEPSSLWKNSGEYIVKVKYGLVFEDQTSFYYTPYATSNDIVTNEIFDPGKLSDTTGDNWKMISDDFTKKEVYIGQSTDYDDDLGYLHVIGEIVNNKNQAINFVRIVASLYDSGQNFVDSDYSYTILDVVPPYGKSPFDIIFMGGSRGVHNYKLQLEYQNTKELPQNLDAKKPRLTIDDIGYVHIKGEIENLGTQTANYVKVVGNIYDFDHQLISTSYTYSTLNDIYPHQSSPYDLIFTDILGDPTSYQIYVESSEYGMIFSSLETDIQDTSETQPIATTTIQPVKERNCIPNRICVFPGDYLIYEEIDQDVRILTEVRFGKMVSEEKIQVENTIKSKFVDEKPDDPYVNDFVEKEILDLTTGFTDASTFGGNCCARFPYVVKIPVNLGDKMPLATGEDPEIFKTEGKMNYKDYERDVLIAKGLDMEFTMDKETGINLFNTIEDDKGEKFPQTLIDTNIIPPKPLPAQSVQTNSGPIEENNVIQETSTAESSGGCLIATATYGSELAIQVQQLREVRENILKTNSGSVFLSGFNKIYYSFSPTLADWERQYPIFKDAVRLTITPMITSLSLLNYPDIDSESEVLGYGISLILLNFGMYFIVPAILIHTLRRRINYGLGSTKTRSQCN